MNRGPLPGFSIQVAPDLPRYRLPPEVCPGVPWPPGFREGINAWSLEFLGTTCVVDDVTVMNLGGNTLVMSPRMYARIRREFGALS